MVWGNEKVQCGGTVGRADVSRVDMMTKKNRTTARTGWSDWPLRLDVGSHSGAQGVAARLRRVRTGRP